MSNLPDGLYVTGLAAAAMSVSLAPLKLRQGVTM
jgi:hypothetical protein